jgi:hypothetical protein
MFPVPDLRFGGGRVLSVRGTAGAQHVGLDQLGWPCCATSPPASSSSRRSTASTWSCRRASPTAGGPHSGRTWPGPLTTSSPRRSATRRCS